ncbi:MAG: substrate-binding domain-containing protein [Opitutaceae bacterium]|nr:substrate-binding domain-containing protein [Opitutaceae bacterium]
MKHHRLAWFALLASVGLCAGPDLPAPYQPEQRVSGQITVWGHGSLGGHTDYIEMLVKRWAEGFSQHHPDVEIVNRLSGTAAAIGALYTGTGDIALLGREIWPMEVEAFQEVKGYKPLGIDVLTGSFKTRNRGYALVVFVHKSNPITGLTLDQIAAVYSAKPPHGAPARRWGNLGLAGEWAERPIEPYGFPLSRGFAIYLAEAAFKGGRLWNPAVREYPDEPGSMGGETDGGHRMLQDLAKDPNGIAYAGLLYTHPDVKAIALATGPGEPLVEPTEQNVMNHSYPLTRIITIFIDRPPGQPVEPRLREFLRYVLSREGQEIVLHHGGGYLPMLRPFAERESRKLD